MWETGETRGRQEPRGVKRVMVNKLRSNFGNGHPFATRSQGNREHVFGRN
jgi:hypothetical protein